MSMARDLSRPRHKAKESHRGFGRLVREAAQKWKRTREQERRVLGLLGDTPIDGPIPASDLAARERCTLSLIDLVGTMVDAAPPHRRYYSITLLPDEGNSIDREPQFNGPRLGKKLLRALSEIGLDTVMAVETQGVTNFPAHGLGRLLMTHGQGLGWTDDPDFDAVQMAARLNSAPEWPRTRLGALAVDINPLPTRDHVLWLAYYISKSPHDAKVLKPHAGGYRLHSVIKDYRPEFALRIFEILSQQALVDLFFAHGDDAKAMLGTMLDQLDSWDRTRKSKRQPVKRFDRSKLWRKLRAVNGSAKFKPVKFLKGKKRPPAVSSVTDIYGAPAAKSSRSPAERALRRGKGVWEVIPPTSLDHPTRLTGHKAFLAQMRVRLRLPKRDYSRTRRRRML